MKRYIPILLALSLLCSCAAPAEESAAPSPLMETESPVQTGTSDTVNADAIARAILRSQPEAEGYTARVDSGAPGGGDLAFYLELYGVQWDVVSDAAIYTFGGVDAREIAVFSLNHGTYAYDETSAVEALNGYLERRRGDFYGYDPEQAALVEQGKAVVGETWVALLICEDMPAAEAAFEELAGVLEAVSEAAVSETSAPEETGSGVQDGLTAKETSEPYNWTDYANEKGWRRFDPPNEFDMTPYDTSAILTAWETGNESGLSEKDAAILAKCKEALDAAITPGMTDFQKELNLHDWLVQSYYGCYDRTVHDPTTPMGREDNLNPYGLLGRGYGICLAYATTFQLLMDLAGVECVTVIGASSSSSSDHAWNMVKLEGEWYGVDPAWNATYREGLDETTMWPWQHRYFNVTSQELRESDHQWDYESIPEAAATRFRWDGTGELPQ